MVKVVVIWAAFALQWSSSVAAGCDNGGACQTERDQEQVSLMQVKKSLNFGSKRSSREGQCYYSWCGGCPGSETYVAAFCDQDQIGAVKGTCASNAEACVEECYATWCPDVPSETVHAVEPEPAVMHAELNPDGQCTDSGGPLPNARQSLAPIDDTMSINTARRANKKSGAPAVQGKNFRMPHLGAALDQCDLVMQEVLEVYEERVHNMNLLLSAYHGDDRVIRSYLKNIEIISVALTKTTTDLRKVLCDSGSVGEFVTALVAGIWNCLVPIMTVGAAVPSFSKHMAEFKESVKGILPARPTIGSFMSEPMYIIANFISFMQEFSKQATLPDGLNSCTTDSHVEVSGQMYTMSAANDMIQVKMQSFDKKMARLTQAFQTPGSSAAHFPDLGL